MTDLHGNERDNLLKYGEQIGHILMSDISDQNPFVSTSVSVTGVTSGWTHDNAAAFSFPRCQLEPKKFWKILRF